MAKFIPGLQLNREFYNDIVGPLMQENFPDLKYAAGLVGQGSDVLGFDTETSMDHDWGPRLHLFFTEEDYKSVQPKVDQMLRKNLPYTYKEFSTHYKTEQDGSLIHQPKFKKSGEVNHLFSFWTIKSFFNHYLGFDPYRQVSIRDWLTFPQQALVEVTAGELYHDDIELSKVREKFAYYPDEIWKYLIRVQWGKIGDELQFQARTGEEGDEVGSNIVAARSVEKVMNLCFLLEKQYAPYGKWFGSSFMRLECAPKFKPIILDVLYGKNWYERQASLAKLYKMCAQMHNRLKITKPLSTRTSDFHGRGYPVLDIVPYVRAIEEVLKTKTLKHMKYPLGAVDQFIDHARIGQLNEVYTELKQILQ